MKPSPADRLLIIDGIGPFFRFCNKKRINWSKIPFADLETQDGLKAEALASIPEDFRTFVRRAREIGYNAVTLDDVAHLVLCEDYSADLRRKIEAYRALFAELIHIASDEGLQVFFTMDIMFFNDSLRAMLGRSRKKTALWLNRKLAELFNEFPIAGVIMRFGESDGVDVRGDFRSELWLKRPGDAQRLLRCLLPTFEQYDRLLIFRTWSVGAHPIGDLGWNEKRFRELFDGLDSPALVISLKYGETDFFRYLPLNHLFFVGRHKKIIEFQARREYEGFGAYPSFVGWDTERYLDKLQQAENVIGASVWCQTGGWGKRRQLTFIRNSSVWVELNAFVIARMVRGDSCEQAIAKFVGESMPHVPANVMAQFLRKSDVVIKDLLYVRELAERHLYFRRLRLPPQLFVFWDRIMIDQTIRKALSCLVRDPEAAIEQGHAAMRQLQEMTAMAREHGIPMKGLRLQLATFEILAAAREFFFRPDDPEVKARLESLKAGYKSAFKRNYSVMLNFNRHGVHRVPIRWLLPLMVREKSRYRMLDQVLTIRLLGMLYPLAVRFRHRIGPKFASQQAMGLDALLK